MSSPVSLLIFWGKALLCFVWFWNSLFLGFTLALFQHSSISYYLGRIFGFGIGWLLNVRVVAIDEDNLYIEEDQGCIFVSNHQSALDLAFIPSIVIKRTHCIAKKSFLYVPFFGFWWWLTGQIFIDRQRRDSAISTLTTTTERIRNQKDNVWIFPEGTRNWLFENTKMKTFKKGAFHMSLDSGAPIVPVVVDRYSKIIDLKSKTYPGGELRVKCLKPFYPEDYSKETIDNYIEDVRNAMVKALEELDS
eukprot:TRINITY_DN140_c0_g1_i1.p1 TRINITY_DN140_c0_g1~~TRINITY_DN140_c0_g1_i1.p1  ORF type:complete len:248 (+),score=38.61 TRINITY_DN140_c0_g1_i1:47-790(+)